MAEGTGDGKAEGSAVASAGISGVERAYFGLTTLAAAFVAYLGFAIPERMDESFTWVVLPPLHARFVAALYLFGAVYMGCCTISRHRSQVTPAPPAVIIFTSLLLLVTLLNLEAFDFDLGPVWVWTVSYMVLPLLGIALIIRAAGRSVGEAPGPPLTLVGHRFLQVQAVLFGVSGALLLVARELMVDVWPWPITNGLAQFYGGPFLAIAYCCWRYSTRRSIVGVAPIALGMLAFTSATLVVSAHHRSLFSASDGAAWVWFAAFGAGAVGFALLSGALLAARGNPTLR